MRIAIVDDDERFSKEVAAAVGMYFEKNRKNVSLERFSNGRRLLCQLSEHVNYDVYFLDVEMEYMTGIELAGAIRMSDNQASIVFLTSHEKYAIDGYSCQACGYLTKDTWKEKLPALLDQIWKREKERTERFYQIQTERKYDRICIDDIVYLEREGKNVRFYCRDNRTYWERNSLGEVFKRLPSEEFAYVNRGQIVNAKYTTHIDQETIELDSRITLQLSRGHITEIRQKIMGYWRTR